MGKKTKVGKQRRDKYYQLAKETGYRARSAFKLVQLNRKYEFLQKSKALIDLCAAPGGWLQVAAQFMPIPSLIIGVDLVPIKPLPNVVTLQDDITKDSCRQALRKELKTWDVDCVLHDGSPNVGQNWFSDAFEQAQLTLSALKLACDFLRRGGCFVTKVFRSKDYTALIETFGKLFKKVHVTKPAASRLESAEIYVFCQHYLKPDRVDPALLDPKLVFKELNLQPEKPRLNLLHPEKTKRKAEGYADGDYTLFHQLKVSEFIESDHHLEALADANEIVIDDPRIAEHEATTSEVRECCKDIKVLGRKELRELLNWRKKLRQYFASIRAKEANESSPTAEKEEMSPEEKEKAEEAALEMEVDAAEKEEKLSKKRKRRREMREKRKKKQRLDLKMDIPGDRPDNPIDQDLFSLKTVDTKKGQQVDYDLPSIPNLDEDDRIDAESASMEDEDDGDGEVPARNNLIMDLEDDGEAAMEARTTQRTKSWFDKEAFADLENDSDEDEEIERMAGKFRHEHGLSAKDRQEKNVVDNQVPAQQHEENSSSAFVGEEGGNVTLQEDEEGVQESPKETKKKQHLSPEELALGELWVNSAKSKRDIIEFAYNRYMNNDDNLPAWFAEDEKKHWKKQLPVTKEQVNYYRQRLKEINARPIKKVLEAKGRKRRRALKKLEQARKRADAVVENPDMNEHEKAREMKRIYKQANSMKKKEEVAYVVAKKGTVGKRVRRPPSVKGRFRMVDPRMKKDMRTMKAAAKKGSTKKGSSKKRTKGKK